MGLNPHPAMRIVANDKDITAAIQERFVALRLTDETGLESDTLEITLADTDPARRIQRPPKGAELEVFLGYGSEVRRMGLFVADEFERSGWPGAVTIRARAAVYDETTKGKKDLQTQKSRSWPDATTLQAMVAKIAKEHGMGHAVAASLAGTILPHYDQTEESDLSFLLRVLKHYDAIVKPAGGKLLVVKRGESKTASGASLPVVTIDATEVTSWTTNQSERDSPGTVVAYWRGLKERKRHQVTVGTGEPTVQLRHHHPNQTAAEQAAQAELNKRARRQNKFSGTLPGRADLMAEGRLVLTGFGLADVDGEWLLTRVEHDLGDGGYTCHVEAELPLSA